MNTLTSGQKAKLSEILTKSFSQLRERNSAYSLRAFSKKIGVSSGALSEILSNKRNITIKTSEKILRNLNYSASEIEVFFKSKASKRNFSNLAIDQYQVLSDWHYLGLLNLIELPGEEHSVAHFAKRLDLPEKKIKEALERLMRLEMIHFVDGEYERTFVRYQTTEDIADGAIKKYHNDTFGLAEKALREVAPFQRDFSSVVIKMNPKNLVKLKKLIRDFQDEVCADIELDNPTEIFHLNVQLYPITNNNIEFEDARKK